MKSLLLFFEHLGMGTLLLLRTLKSLREIGKVLKHPFWEQMDVMFFGSVPLVILTAVFSGLVTTVQIGYYGRGYAPLDYVGVAVAKMVMIELGPVLTALIVAGRIGAGIAAEIGTMRVTEQIDSLECMGIDPVRFLVLPRVLAGMVILPALTIVADLTAILTSSIAADFYIGVPTYIYFHGIRLFFAPKDLWGGLIKSLFFGIIITMVGSHWGFATEKGATGVGKATTSAVVTSSLFIIFADYILTVMIYR